MFLHWGQSSLWFVIVTDGSSNDALSIWYTDGCSNPQIFLPSPIYTQLGNVTAKGPRVAHDYSNWTYT